MIRFLHNKRGLIRWSTKVRNILKSLKSLIDLVAHLSSKNIHFKSLTDSIDTSTLSGRFFFHVIASFAQMERELIVERTKAGLAAAKKLGRVGGRKRSMTDSKLANAKKLLAAGALPKDVAKDLGVSIATLYRWIPAR
jgi:DNA invertase Pin-like site-specific DNA recombinase